METAVNPCLLRPGDRKHRTRDFQAAMADFPLGHATEQTGASCRLVSASTPESDRSVALQRNGAMGYKQTSADVGGIMAAVGRTSA